MNGFFNWLANPWNSEHVLLSSCVQVLSIHLDSTLHRLAFSEQICVNTDNFTIDERRRQTKQNACAGRPVPAALPQVSKTIQK